MLFYADESFTVQLRDVQVEHGTDDGAEEADREGVPFPDGIGELPDHSEQDDNLLPSLDCELAQST